MTEILIDIETAEDSEYCEDCRFLDMTNEHCVLFGEDLCCDATMMFFRCDICLEREGLGDD